jgi:hypothetical protein
MTLCLADTAEFGILRLIVADPGRAAEVLNTAGWAVTLTEVVAVEVEDQPGGLAEVLGVFEQAGLNVEYVYAFALRRDDRAILVFRFQDPEQAIAALAKSGHRVLDAERLQALVGRWLGPDHLTRQTTERPRANRRAVASGTKRSKLRRLAAFERSSR